MNIKIIPERLIALRKELGLTQQEAADLTEMTQPAYQRYEAGTRSPSIQVARSIANAFNTSLSYLSGESDNKNQNCLIINESDNPILYSVVEECRNCSDKQLRQVLAYFNELRIEK